MQFVQFLLVSGVIIQSLAVFNLDNEKNHSDFNLNPWKDLEPLEPLNKEKSSKIEVSSLEVEINKIKDLYDKELITDDEFQKLRKRILDI